MCNTGQPFFYANNLISSDWTYPYNRHSNVNSICGFGKDTASARSTSFISKAVANGDLSANVYSVSLDPHLASTSATRWMYQMKIAEGELSENEAHSPIHLGRKPYEFSLENVSTLNMGGYDENDLVGDIYWYDTSDCVGGWN